MAVTRARKVADLGSTDVTKAELDVLDGIPGELTTTEVGYLDGVTSSIQTQVDTKLASTVASSTYAPLASPTFTGSVAGITKTHVGLGNVDNTSDATKQTNILSAASASDVGLGNVTNESKSTMFASPSFTSVPVVPTAAASTNTNQIASTAFVTTAIDNLIDSAPGALNTLNELAAAINDDDDYHVAVTASLSGKVAKSGDTMSGVLNMGDNNITNVGDISLDSISSDAGTSINVVLGSDAGDDFLVDTDKLVVEGDTGKVGIGVTPDSEWHSTMKAVQINSGSLSAHDSYPHYVQLNANVVQKDSGEKRLNTSYKASQHRQWDGTHIFKVAPSGSGDISWTTAMTIDNDGNVGIGITAPATTLHVVGNLWVNAGYSDTPMDGTPGTNDICSLIGSGGYWGLRTDNTTKGFNLDVYNAGSPISAFHVAQGGNVGIGDTDPSEAKLSLVQANDLNCFTIDNNSGSSYGIYVENTGSSYQGLLVTSNHANPSKELVKFQADANFDVTVLEVENNGDGYGLLIDSNSAGKGLVIDNINGNYALEVYQGSSTSTCAYIHNDGTGQGLYVQQDANGDAILVDNNGNSNAINIDNDGTASALYIDQNASKPSIVASDGAEGYPAYSFRGEDNTGMFRPGATALAFSVGGGEAMRIQSDEQVGIGTSSNNWIDYVDGFHVTGGYGLGGGTKYIAGFRNGTNSNDAHGILIHAGYSTNNGTTHFITFKDSGSGTVGHIQTVSGNLQLVNTSDERLKKNIRDSEWDALNIINNSRVRDFEWKDGGHTMKGGFIAQELKEVWPDAVTEPTEIDDRYHVGTTYFIPMLVKAVQELTAKVTALENA